MKKNQKADCALWFLLWYQEVDNLLFDINAIRALRCLHQTTVDTHHRPLRIVDKHLPGAIGMHTAVVEEAASDQQP